jgi:hypothetical protein
VIKGIVLFAVLSVMPTINGAVAPLRPVELPVAAAPAPEAVQVPEPEIARTVEPLAAVNLKTPVLIEEPHDVCRVGLIVMIPDGREGRVTSREDGICRVLAYGEGYVSLWLEDMVEPVYPQDLPVRKFGH